MAQGVRFKTGVLASSGRSLGDRPKGPWNILLIDPLGVCFLQ